MPPSREVDRSRVSLGSHRPTVILTLPCLVEKKQTKVCSLAILFSAADWDRSPARFPPTQSTNRNFTNPLVDKSDDSAAVRNGVSRPVDLIYSSRGQYIPKGKCTFMRHVSGCIGKIGEYAYEHGRTWVPLTVLRFLALLMTPSKIQ
ncbi:unnamed protein product [Victoria cruziana]